MTQSSSKTDDGLKIGDWVRLVPNKLAWRAEPYLQGKIGEIIERRDDGRVSIRFDSGRLLLGRQPGSFERALAPKAKGK
jgi:hypothetical protein